MANEPRTGDRVSASWQSGFDDAADDGTASAEVPAALVLFETYLAVPESVAAARTIAAEFATRAGASQKTVNAVKLAVSEAVTNIVAHAYTDTAQGGLIHLEANLAPGELQVSVSDTGRGLRPRSNGRGLGLGLAIIGELADKVELLQGATGGLRVLMRFAMPASTTES